MLQRLAELRAEVETVRSELRDESAQRKIADVGRDDEHRHRVELEAALSVAEQKLSKVSAALGLASE